MAVTRYWGAWDISAGPSVLTEATYVLAAVVYCWLFSEETDSVLKKTAYFGNAGCDCCWTLWKVDSALVDEVFCCCVEAVCCWPFLEEVDLASAGAHIMNITVSNTCDITLEALHYSTIASHYSKNTKYLLPNRKC